MSDPWQDDAEVEDDRDEEPTGPAGGKPLDPEEVDGDDEEEDSDLWDDDDSDDAAA
jgi:hypothetical protein